MTERSECSGPMATSTTARVAASGPGPGRRPPLLPERLVAHPRKGRAFTHQRLEHGRRAGECPLARERREQLGKPEPARPRLTRRLHGGPEALHAPGVVRE